MDFGQGTLHISATVNSDVEIVSRALTADQQQFLAESAIIWISNDKGLLYEFKGASNVPSSLRLFSGSYTAEAWVGDSVPASWDATFYKSGFKLFDIASGSNTDITLTCKVANTLASVSYSDEALAHLTSPVMTVSLDDGITDGSHSLVFDESKIGEKGRFMINSRTKGLTWTLTGTESDGTPFTKSGTITEIKAATEYRLNVKFVSHDVNLGGAYFDIVIDEEPAGDNTDVIVSLPPHIISLTSSFDENNSCRGEEGKIGRKSIFVSAAARLTDLILKSDALMPIVNLSQLDLFQASNENAQKLRDAGINWELRYDDNTDSWGLRINFEEEFTNSLPEADHTFEITATDEDSKTSTAAFTISVTNAAVATAPVIQSSISYTSATLEGQVMKEANEYGFEIREYNPSRSYEDWTKVKATVSGNRMYASVSDLTAGATYEYRVYADDFVSTDTRTFSTPSLPQLPNAGFEEWSGTTPLLICANEASMFWDSGNHGSATMSKNVTEKDTSVKHSGNYSAMLKSQFVGVGSIGKFAAGNIFVGKYLDTDGTDGVLGWGREWNCPVAPKALKGWAKYTPGTIASNVFKKTNAPDEIKAEFPSGGQDKGIIYVALVDNSAVSEYNGSSWPVIIKTKTSELFDKNGSNVKSYGEIIFSEATPGSEMVEFTIDLKDVNPSVNYTHILIVASASKAGDYFLGGEGSTLWIDDLELVY